MPTIFIPTPTQLLAARTVLGLTMEKLVLAMHVGSQTIVRVESAAGLARANRSTIESFLRFYESKGLRFIDDGDRVGLTWPKLAEAER